MELVEINTRSKNTFAFDSAELEKARKLVTAAKPGQGVCLHTTKDPAEASRARGALVKAIANSDVLKAAQRADRETGVIGVYLVRAEG